MMNSYCDYFNGFDGTNIIMKRKVDDLFEHNDKVNNNFNEANYKKNTYCKNDKTLNVDGDGDDDHRETHHKPLSIFTNDKNYWKEVLNMKFLNEVMDHIYLSNLSIYQSYISIIYHTFLACITSKHLSICICISITSIFHLSHLSFIYHVHHI